MRAVKCHLLIALPWVAPSMAQAHGFAQRYDLPVPLALYISGSAAAVALSFVVIAFFARNATRSAGYPRFDLLTMSIGRAVTHPLVIAAARGVTVAVFFLIIVAGMVGDQNAFNNIAPTMVWVIWWVGFAYLSGLVGNIWAVINPWHTIFRFFERRVRRVSPGARRPVYLPYPAWLGDSPAIILFLWFVWAELVWPASDVPASLAMAAAVYSLITWTGMFLFGASVWLKHGEIFSIAFGLLARFAPTEVRYEGDRRELNLRPWAVGLLVDEPVTFSRMLFVIVMLASVTFDGLLATPLWATLAEWMLLSDALRPLVLLLQALTGDAVSAVSTLALLTFIFIFFLLYLLFSVLMRVMTPESVQLTWSVSEVARLFVLSLIPIALAYHLAHYLSFLLIVGQYMIPLISDPFGFGWDLFGTSLYMVNIGIVNARFVWYTSVIAIVVGHIVAVYLAHVTAERAFGDRRAVLFSQVPMLLLMVCYTMISLWILAQPVVELG